MSLNLCSVIARWRCCVGVVGPDVSIHRYRAEVTNEAVSRTQLESWATAGNSPVDENRLRFRFGVPKYHGGYSV
jgi:hypothetical protein